MLDNVLFLAIFIGIAFLVFEMARLLQNVLGRPRRKDPKIAVEEYYPALFGAAMGFLLMAKYPPLALVSAGVGFILGQAGKTAYRWFTVKLTEEKKAGEILLLYELIGVYANAGYSLYEALLASSDLVSLISGPLKVCVRTWSQGPQRALEKMGKDIGMPEADVLIKILQRAAEVGPERLVDFLKQESEVMENIRQYRIERGLGVRPLIQTLYLLFPGLALIGVTMLPVGYYISKTIMSIRLGG